MNTYIKHVSHLSTNGLWEISFDATCNTPKEVLTMSDCYSTITLSNSKITYQGDEEYTKAVTEVRDSLVVNDLSMGYSIGTGGFGGPYSKGETLASYPVHIDDVADLLIEHDSNGIGLVHVLQTLVFYGGTPSGKLDTITFDFSFNLNTINIAGKGATEMGPEVREAILNNGVAIKTRLLYKRGDQNTATIMNDTEESNDLVVLTESDAIKTWELNDERYVPNNGFVGHFVARTLTGELHNIDDDFSIENKDVELQIGIVQLGTRYRYLATEDGEILVDNMGNKICVSDLGDDVTNWYSLGNFLVTRPEDDEVADNTRFEAFDYTVKFNKDFNADFTNDKYQVSFNNMISNGESVTAGWLAEYTCSQVGVKLSTTEFTNSDFVITSNQLVSGESCRDVMKYISQLAFGWCRIGWDNNCYIDEPVTMSLSSTEDTTLTNDNYYSLVTQKNTFGPVNRIVVGMSAIDGEDISVDNEESITNDGLTEITVMDNPLLNTNELRASVAETGQKLFGMTYTPIEMETPGHPWLKGNELLSVYDMENNLRPTYAFNRTLRYTGHIKTKLSTPAPTEQEKTVAYNKSIYKTLRDVGVKVDKQNGLINIINSKTLATEDGLSSLETRFETEITDTYSKTQIQEIINGTAEDGTAVSSVKTTAGTFDKNGLTIEQTNSSTKTNINSNGMVILNTSGTSANDELLNVNSEGVDAKNVRVRTYLNIGSHSRMEDYTHTDGSVGTGMFWIGSDF